MKTDFELEAYFRNKLSENAFNLDYASQLIKDYSKKEESVSRDTILKLYNVVSLIVNFFLDKDRINLNDKKLGDQSLKFFRAAFKKTNSKYLNLDNNCIKYEFIELFNILQHSKKINHAYLASNLLDDSIVAAFVKKHLPAEDDIEQEFVKNTTLIELNLASNHNLTKNCVIDLSKILNLFVNLKILKILLNMNSIG
jgi:hypothetical protein